ncbi:MAG: glycosyltransferase [Deltaproteobacteria bacterium]|nr:glycosyltransferase [Deltaproteobacteria bacterium]
MKIGIEIRQIVPGSSGGMAMLVKGVLDALFEQYPEEDFFIFSTIFNRGLVGQNRKHVEVITLPIANFFEALDRLSKRIGLSVLIRTYPAEVELNFSMSKQIFLVPDLQHEFYPEFFSSEVVRSRRVAFNKALVWSAAIGTLSEFTKRTIEAHEWTRCRDIFIVHPGLPFKMHHDDVPVLTPENQRDIPSKAFFIYPANLWPHKNHLRILKAFAGFLDKTGHDLQLILTGHREGWSSLNAAFPSLPVFHLGFVSDSLLRRLYQKATALVFFSLYEGFGIPLLEAFDAGIPVMCSNTTSLPEVGGDAVLSCDPTDTDAMSGLMASVVEDNKIRNELISRGKRRLQLYGWESSAKNLYEACERVVCRKSGEIRVSGGMSSNDYPLVTIVTPSFNQGQFLRKTIDSVLNQSYSHIEYLVMDGGSQDNSVDILKSYGDKICWVSELDHGQSDAINKGFNRSNGEVLAYLNSDDLLLPNAVSTVIEYLLQHPDWDLVYGGAQYIDKEERVTGIYNTADYSFERLMQDCCICQPAAFWRRRIANKVGPFSPKLQYAMDFDYWLRIDRAGGRTHHIQDMLASSRLYAENKTLSARREIYKEIFQVCLSHGGYVDYSYFVGFWDHLINENRYAAVTALGRYSKLIRLLAMLHLRFFDFRRMGIRNIPFALRRTYARALSRSFSKGGIFYRISNPFLVKLADKRPVSGLWSDNWLGPRCSFFKNETSLVSDDLIGGIPAIDMDLTVKLDNKEVLRKSLKEKTYESIRFSIDPNGYKRIQLNFSRHVLDPARRRLSFLLFETNLFREEDIL